MRHFIIALCLWIISQKFRDVTSIRGTLKANVYKLENRRGESSKGEPSKGKPSKGEPSKGEKHKKETSDEEAVPSKKAKPCTRCDECDPNPCVCYLQGDTPYLVYNVLSLHFINYMRICILHELEFNYVSLHQKEAIQ